MSTQPSIPASPPPGKDPPRASSSSTLHSLTNLDTKGRDPNASPSPSPSSTTKRETENESENSTRNPSPESARKTSLTLQTNADTKAMPPPPIPSSKPHPHPRPVITTRYPSSSNANNPPFSPSLAQSTSQNAGLQDQPETETGTEVERERPPFTPFFTLVNDLSGGEQSTHHPSQVHYIFADDDVSEVLTGALLRAMDREGEGLGDADGEVEEGEGEEDEVEEGETSSGSSATFRRDGTRIRSERSRAKLRDKLNQRDKERGATGSEERVVIVDVNETGDAVTGVSSLSPSWQVLSAEIGKAPTWDKDGAESEGGRGELAGGLMLRIEGVGLDCGELAGAGAGLGIGVGAGIPGKGKGKEREGDVGSANASGMGEEEMQALMEGFDRKMGMLRRIVQRGSRESLVDGEKS